jgi:hypothetical protein
MPYESLKRAWLVSFENHDSVKLFVVIGWATVMQAGTVPKCQIECNLPTGGFSIKGFWYFARGWAWN